MPNAVATRVQPGLPATRCGAGAAPTAAYLLHAGAVSVVIGGEVGLSDQAKLAEYMGRIDEIARAQHEATERARTALEGAACMNNTFCLAIFMALILFKGLAWQFSAEQVGAP